MAVTRARVSTTGNTPYFSFVGVWREHPIFPPVILDCKSCKGYYMPVMETIKTAKLRRA
jgi:hypothetical protein